MSSAAWRTGSHCGTQYIQGGGVVAVKSEDQNSFRGDIGGQIGVMYLIKIVESIYQSIESAVSLVHVYGHRNSGKTESTLTPLAYLDVILDELAEHIMASFILWPVTRNTIVVGFSDPYGPPNISIYGSPVHSNIAQSIFFKSPNTGYFDTGSIGT